MDWPITGKAAGYVRAKSLPNIGEWTEFSPADIRTFCGEINRHNPEYTAPTKPKTPCMREFRAWRAMFEAIGCKNITPFERDISDMEFWSCAKDPKGDIETILNLFSNGLLNTKLNSTIRNNEFENYKDTTNVFWYSLRESLDSNPNGSNGKIRILSIVAENFIYEELMENLQVPFFKVT
ncbi:unnamed protein product [Rhizophagus irregularis]|nr:unnamed protein product [Rhizophagus irregularis]